MRAVAGEHPHRAVLPPHRGHGQLRAARLSGVRGRPTSRSGCTDAGYETALVGKYLNDYSLDGHNASRPAGTTGRRWTASRWRSTTTTSSTRTAASSTTGSRPADYSTTVLTRQGGGVPTHVQAAVLPLLRARRTAPPRDPGAARRREARQARAVHVAVAQPGESRREPWAAATRARSPRPASPTPTTFAAISSSRCSRSTARSRRSCHTLAKRTQLDRTVIFYTSDNGFLWGEHRLGGKLWPYGASTHVPLIVRTPWTHQRHVNTEPVLNIDFASTISELAGIEPGARRTARASCRCCAGRRFPGGTTT